jgi:hypothetical protein
MSMYRFTLPIVLIATTLIFAEDSGNKLHHLVTATSVHMRDSPSTEGSILATMDKGDVVYSLDWKDGWSKVKHEKSGQTGWMFGDYLSAWQEADIAVPGVRFADFGGERSVLGQFEPARAVPGRNAA